MTDLETDKSLTALLAEVHPAKTDPAFTDRVVALASLDLALRRSRRRAMTRVVREAMGLVTVLISFVALARMTPDSAAGLGDAVALNSPAMLGVLMLAAWIAAMRGTPAAQ